MDALELTFLGTGTSVGLPIVGCGCVVCTSPDPRDKRTRASVLVRAPDASWVVDTGPDFRFQCLREGITELDAVLVTHAHTDHIMGFDDLRRFTVGADQSLPVYARPSVLDDLRRIFAFAFNGENRYPGYFKPEPRPVTAPFQIGGTEVAALPVTHGKVETVGFLFSRGGRPRLAYLPDCKTLSDEARERIAGVEVLVIDGLRFTPHVTHMNIEEALDEVRRACPGRAFLTHFSDEVLHARDEADMPDGVRFAYDGLKIRC